MPRVVIYTVVVLCGDRRGEGVGEGGEGVGDV